MAKKNNIISPTDEILLQTYMLGWTECYSGDYTSILAFKDSVLLKRAYEIGWHDYIMGDDVSSINSQTDEEILKHIKNT